MTIQFLDSLPSHLTLNAFVYQHPSFQILTGSQDNQIYWVSLHPHNEKINMNIIKDHSNQPKIEEVSISPELSSFYDDYFNNGKANNSFSFSLIGSPFQHQIWKALYDIPSGATKTYREIAVEINNPKAVRAVASAIGKNPVSIFIPCHRVIGSDQKLRGYRWGIDIKKQLLLNEEKQ